MTFLIQKNKYPVSILKDHLKATQIIAFAESKNSDQNFIRKETASRPGD